MSSETRLDRAQAKMPCASDPEAGARGVSGRTGEAE